MASPPIKHDRVCGDGLVKGMKHLESTASPKGRVIHATMVHQINEKDRLSIKGACCLTDALLRCSVPKDDDHHHDDDYDDDDDDDDDGNDK